MRQGGGVVALLTITAIVLIVGIEYTYSEDYAAKVPRKLARMHMRALCFALLSCIGVLLVAVTYLLASRGLRDACNSAPAPLSALAAAPVVEVSEGDGPWRLLKPMPSGGNPSSAGDALPQKPA